jgi:O-antigen/teichoic acid export membrane protein
MFVILIPLITSPYVSRTIGAENFGTYIYSQTIAGYFGLFALLGIINYGSRYISRVRNNSLQRNKILSEIVILQILLTVIFALSYIFFISIFTNIKLLNIQAFYYFSVALDISWFYIGMEQFKTIIFKNIFIKVAMIICIFLFVHNKSDLLIYTFIMSFGLLCGQLILWLKLKEYIDFKYVNKLNIITHLKSSSTLFIPVIAINVYKLSDKLMLGFMLSHNYVAYYSNAEKFETIAIGFIISITNIMFPKITNLIYNRQEVKAKIILYFTIRIILILSIAMAFTLAGCSIELAPLFYGNEFMVSGRLMQFLSISIIIISLNQTLTQLYFIPTNKEKIYTRYVIIGSIINIIINFMFIPKLYAYGAIIGTISTEFLVMIMMIITVKEIDFLRIFIKTIPYLFTGIIMFLLMRFIGVYFGIKIRTIILQIFVGCFVFLMGSYTSLLLIDKELKELAEELLKNKKRKAKKYVAIN